MPILTRFPGGGGKRPLDPSRLSPTLAENSWKTIARASEEGIARTLWKVGDEMDIVLSGDHKGSITMQIAGFDHDDLVTGGKAGITFLSKQTLSAEMMDSSSVKSTVGWRATQMRSQTVPKIRASLPADLQKIIKTVLKSSSEGAKIGGGNHVTEDDIFIPSLSEVFDTDAIAQKFSNNQLTEDWVVHAKNDGDRYGVFRTDGDIQKKMQGASNVAAWWTRSAIARLTNYFFVITQDAKIGTLDHSRSSCICFGFCV